MTIRSARVILLAALLAACPALAVERTEQEAKAREIFARIISFHTSVGLGQVPAMANYRYLLLQALAGPIPH